MMILALASLGENTTNLLMILFAISPNHCSAIVYGTPKLDCPAVKMI
jgi:hypothetical protein